MLGIAYITFFGSDSRSGSFTAGSACPQAICRTIFQCVRTSAYSSEPVPTKPGQHTSRMASRGHSEMGSGVLKGILQQLLHGPRTGGQNFAAALLLRLPPSGSGHALPVCEGESLLSLQNINWHDDSMSRSSPVARERIGNSLR